MDMIIYYGETENFMLHENYHVKLGSRQNCMSHNIKIYYPFKVPLRY